MLWETFKASNLRSGVVTFNGNLFTVTIEDDHIKVDNITINFYPPYAHISSLPSPRTFPFIRRVCDGYEGIILEDGDIEYYQKHGKQRPEELGFIPTPPYVTIDVETTKDIVDTFLEKRVFQKCVIYFLT